MQQQTCTQVLCVFSGKCKHNISVSGKVQTEEKEE